MSHLIGKAIKFSRIVKSSPQISISCDIFQQLHGQTEYKGTGIGLAICKRIVENLNGFITADAEVNKGALFRVYLPAI